MKLRDLFPKNTPVKAFKHATLYGYLWPSTGLAFIVIAIPNLIVLAALMYTDLKKDAGARDNFKSWLRGMSNNERQELLDSCAGHHDLY